jgi:acyl CoA:acetate/3-ketoacid CoA transferase alpha subunit
MANKALDQIKDGDTVTFSGFGTLGVGDATDSIDKIKFTVYKDNVQVATADVNAFIDPTQTTATTQVYRANYDYVVSGAGTYRVVIKVHRVRGNVWLE